MAITEQLSFTKLESVSNQNSIHGIYPYRGKISSLDAANVISQLPHDKVLLDPFCGSGTIVYEAAKRLRYAIGVDNNPIAIQIANGKINQFSPEASVFRLNQIIEKIDFSSIHPIPPKAERYFHPDTANEIMLLKQHYHEFNNYEKAVFLGTICLVARACNHYKWSSTQIGQLSENKRYVNFADRLLSKITKHGYPLPSNNAKVILGDTRKLSELIPPKSVDIVYTSPPYFDCLDYTSYYTRIVHHVFSNDFESIKSGLIQNRGTYEQDMIHCLDEIEKVTTDDAIIIFVVGDKKIGDRVINGGDFFTRISKHKPIHVVQREYTKTASKIWDSINKTKRSEQIVVWDKSSPLDKPWHLGTLKENPLPPEAIPYIILVQHVAEQYPELVTIRQAQWIARFYGIFGDYQRLKDKDKLEVAGVLYELAKAYADHEIICYLSGTPPDTSELDKELREGRIPEVSIPIVVGSQHVIFNRDFTFKVDSKTAKQIENSQKEGEK